MIEELKQKGFSAIYLERNGFESETEWETLEYELSEYLNVIPMVSDDKTMSCFYFGNTLEINKSTLLIITNMLQ